MPATALPGFECGRAEPLLRDSSGGRLGAARRGADVTTRCLMTVSLAACLGSARHKQGGHSRECPGPEGQLEQLIAAAGESPLWESLAYARATACPGTDCTKEQR